MVGEVEVHRNYVKDIKTQEQSNNPDIRNVVIDETIRPKPLYLPPRVTINQKSYGKLYDYLHFDLPTGKMDEDPTTNVLMAPPSGYSNTNDGRILSRLCERKVLKFERVIRYRTSEVRQYNGETKKQLYFSAQW